MKKIFEVEKKKKFFFKFFFFGVKIDIYIIDFHPNFNANAQTGN
jgi:hypothetical protein